MLFRSFRHNPFTIYPTHRMIRVGATHASPLQLLRQKGILKKVGTVGAVLSHLSKPRVGAHLRVRPRMGGYLGPPLRYDFGVYTKKDGFFILTLNDCRSENIVDKLDVAVLHKHIIAPCFGIRSIEKSDKIDFTRDPEVACRNVEKGLFDIAIFLRPTSLEEMIEVSKKGLKMPQKSTYFYPKLLSGLVFHRFEKVLRDP